MPSTCSSKVGRGSRSNSAMIAPWPPVMAPVGLPLASFSNRPPGGRSASLLMFSALIAARRQHRPAVPELHVDGVVRRRGHELRLRRPPVLLELLHVPAAGDDQPRAGLSSCAPRRGSAPSASAQRTRADPVHLGAEAERGANGVQVRVDQAGDHRAALQIDHARRRPGQLAHVRRAAERRDLPVADRERFLRVERASTVTILPLTRTVSGVCAAAGSALAIESNSTASAIRVMTSPRARARSSARPTLAHARGRGQHAHSWRPPTRRGTIAAALQNRDRSL